MDIIEEKVIVTRVKLTDQEIEAIKTISSIKCEAISCDDCPLQDQNYEYSDCIRNYVLKIAMNNKLISEEDYEKLLKS